MACHQSTRAYRVPDTDLIPPIEDLAGAVEAVVEFHTLGEELAAVVRYNQATVSPSSLDFAFLALQPRPAASCADTATVGR